MILLLFEVALFLVAAFTTPSVAGSGFSEQGGHFWAHFPFLNDFKSSLPAGLDNLPVGLLIPGHRAQEIVQQPGGNSIYVSTQPDVVTQFAPPYQYNTLGLLAHNTLGGSRFNNLEPGGVVMIIFGDGHLVSYRIVNVEKYQAIDPLSATSDFIDVAGVGPRQSSTKLFKHIYGPSNRLVLQTCIAAHGEGSWGRLFVIAEPVFR